MEVAQTSGLAKTYSTELLKVWPWYYCTYIRLWDPIPLLSQTAEEGVVAGCKAPFSINSQGESYRH